ncbi:unnamed protein product [Trifolium pratense]|uniref:Uncharacterized protein n=1 Tax=Trifolium pratense TaxID=57577 RepID=A0ACB0L2T4_TRIPR|nr:unnamed protein product [Trifolium pratense]
MEKGGEATIDLKRDGIEDLSGRVHLLPGRVHILEEGYSKELLFLFLLTTLVLFWERKIRLKNPVKALILGRLVLRLMILRIGTMTMFLLRILFQFVLPICIGFDFFLLHSVSLSLLWWLFFFVFVFSQMAEEFMYDLFVHTRLTFVSDCS